MTCYDLFGVAVNLMGLQEQKSELNKHAEICAKSVCNDLGFRLNAGGYKPPESLHDEILLDERVLNDVAPYGVAAFLALLIMDGEKQQLFTQMYNQKRLSLSSAGAVKDVLPTPEE